MADLLRQQRAVLVLDGLEPLQHASKGMRGELKDRAVRQLLKSLAGQNNGLCIITTRIAVHELSDRAHICSHDLQNLVPADGVKLLQSLDVRGRDSELEKAVMEYGCHALALSLLGSLLHQRFEGDILKRDLLTALVKEDGDRTSRHAFKVMQAYQEWFASDSDRAPELAVLYLLGLFDHPIEKDVLQVLWDAQIPNLTEEISAEHWQDAITALRDEHHLLFRYHGMDDPNNAHQSTSEQMDCHPLIRKYFGQQLREQQPDAWQKAHARLYDYYKALPKKEFPDTLAEMQPLFSAVAHGCAAGLHQQVIYEVFERRVSRNDRYIVSKLGAFSDALAVISHFFITPWHTPASILNDADQAAVLGRAGFCLRSSLRPREALEPMLANIKLSVQQKHWSEAASGTNNLSELNLVLGNVVAAVVNGQQSVDYADLSGDMMWRMRACATHADALHQTGETARALERFMRAEQIQHERQPESLYLYSLYGFQYCDLLLAQGDVAVVLGRYQESVKWRQSSDSLLDRSLEDLMAGRAHYLQGHFLQATDWLDRAVANLRKAGAQEFIPRGLLARAALNRDTHNPNYDFARARQDLQEVHDIAEPSGMRLHLTDYHLEMARLLIAEQENPPPAPVEKGESVLSLQQHIDAAAKLIEDTGYKRRLPELEALQKSI